MIKKKRIEHNIVDLIPLLTQSLKEDRDVIFAYLFGSYAQNKTFPLSDIDIALYLHKDIEDFYSKKLILLEVINKILLTDEIDLVILNEAPLYLQFEIIKTGKLLFCHDHLKRIKFASKLIMLYLDTEPLRRLGRFSLFKRYGGKL
ncbi:MAG: type VII toxin-antitoxin system MntA family adenylyltransferase antitoxin [Planctomycetota bacterium]